MSNLKLMHNRLFDGALVTSNAPELLPATNLQIYDNSLVFRTNQLTNVIIRIKFDSPQYVSGLVPRDHNLSPFATIQWRGFESDDFTGEPVLDTGEEQALPIKPLDENIWGIDDLGASIFDQWDNSKKSVEFWVKETAVHTQEIIINDPQNPAGFIDINRIYNGLALTPRVNFSYNAKLDFVSTDDTGIGTADGSYHTRDEDEYRIADIDLKWVDEADRPLFVNFFRNVKHHQDFYVSLYPNASPQKSITHAFAGKILGNRSITNAFYNNFRIPLKIREA
ncbi:hypothetical protein SG34_010605 [Thalassomonas viridans]|uniref:Uncharacterized protein n=1 Tax=Thalassomonas viridans TaxID=137584 RepID=A0AAE9Z5V1_9GAMM|nr:hypothetical protein [Thalassomonas viridans]WDE07296.1 hypothetical protein SG34_010605 [Thalassomonas viridans]